MNGWKKIYTYTVLQLICQAKSNAMHILFFSCFPLLLVFDDHSCVLLFVLKINAIHFCTCVIYTGRMVTTLVLAKQFWAFLFHEIMPANIPNGWKFAWIQRNTSTRFQAPIFRYDYQMYGNIYQFFLSLFIHMH